MKAAVNAGFSRALATILDANVTTIIAGACLFLFGSGSVQGFAATLIIGVLVSLITAVFFTKRILIWIIDIMHIENGDYNYAMSILKSNNGDPSSCLRYTFSYNNAKAGEGRFIHTYMGDGNPCPASKASPNW